jgi:hypothetical protein
MTPAQSAVEPQQAPTAAPRAERQEPNRDTTPQRIVDPPSLDRNKGIR